MVAVSATEFAENFALYREKAMAEPIMITSNDQASGYFISAQSYAEYARIKARARRAYYISEMHDRKFDAIMQTFVDPKFDHLNTLLEG